MKSGSKYHKYTIIMSYKMIIHAKNENRARAEALNEFTDKMGLGQSENLPPSIRLEMRSNLEALNL
jgi:hypothetical protein